MKRAVDFKVMTFDNGFVRGLVLDNKQIPENTICKIVWNDNQKGRSLNQNSCYWLFLTFAVSYLKSDDPTLTATELHEAMKHLFLPKIIMIRSKKGVKPLMGSKSTTKLSKLEFMDYFESVKHHMGTMGVPVEIFDERYKELS